MESGLVSGQTGEIQMTYATRLAILGLLSSPISAQVTSTGTVMPAAPATPAQTTSQVPTVAAIEPVAQINVLRAGTEIPMITREELTTKKKQLRVGQRVQIEVASSITQNGVVVIPGGTPGVAELTEVRNKGMWGKSGYIAARIISLRLGDRQIRLSGTFDDKGVTGTGGVVAAVAFLPVAGFFTTGTSASIPSGSGIKAFLDEDIAFRPIAAAPQILEVPAIPASAPPVAPTASTPN